jgi:DNA-binding MarR family transcriptional regulator
MTASTALHSLAAFRYQIRRFLHFSRQAASAAGLDPQQHQMLLVIAGAPPDQPIHIGYLAQRLFLHHNTAVELVNRLERSGLARRIPSEQDRRRVGVRISAKGHKLLARLTRYHLTELRTAGPALIRALQAVITGAVPGAVTGARTRSRTRSNAPRRTHRSAR